MSTVTAARYDLRVSLRRVTDALDGVLRVLLDRHYAGRLIVEHDWGWDPPAESAAIGRRVLAAALRRLGSPRSEQSP